nr:MAG TPA: hypothetical protein [Caudoviricetes sp.]
MTCSTVGLRGSGYRRLMSTGWPQIAQRVPHVAAACQSSCLTLIPPHVMTLVYQPRVSS